MNNKFKKIDKNNEYNEFDVFMSKNEQIINNNKINGFEFITNGKLDTKIKHETGIEELDSVIYGCPTGTIVDLYGSSSSGKSQILFQIAVNISTNKKKTLFIDSSGNFRPERIIQLSKAKGYDSKKVLNNIYTIRCNSLDCQLGTISKIKEFIKNNNTTCIMLDDLTRNFTDHSFEFRNEMQDILSEYIRELADLAWENNIAVIVTNSIRAKIDDTKIREKETFDFIINKLIHLKVSLKRMEEIWLARNNDGKQCIFNITEDGIGKV